MTLVLVPERESNKYSKKKSRTINVNLDRDVHDKLVQFLEKKVGPEAKREIEKNLTKITKEFLDKQEILEHYKPFLHIVDVRNNILYVDDPKQESTKRVIAVEAKPIDNNSDKIYLQCTRCNLTDCVHVAFCASSEKLGELNLNVKRQPKDKYGI